MERQGNGRVEDERIIELYFQRSEEAISETSLKYGAYCRKIALNILFDLNDAEECVNDTYLRAWNAIPPSRPERFATFLGRITRNLSLDRFRKKSAHKRRGPEIELALDELGECVPAQGAVEDELEYKELGAKINEFLIGEDELERNMFILRYWYIEPVKSVAKRFSISESKVKSSLFRMRKRLRIFLEKEGVGFES